MPKNAKFLFIFIVLGISSIVLVQGQDDTANSDLVCLIEPVQQAFELAQENCQELGDEMACYGNNTINATLRSTDVSFADVGDQVEIAEIEELELSALLNVEPIEWGVSILNVPVRRGDDAEMARFVMFGNVKLLADITDEQAKGLDPIFSSGLQAFQLLMPESDEVVDDNAADESLCEPLPRDGLLIQAGRFGAEIDIVANGVQIKLGSTMLLHAEEDSLVMELVEGRAEITSGGETVLTTAGTRTTVKLDSNLTPVGPPVVEPYEEAPLQNVPTNLLPDDVEVAPAWNGQPISGEWTVTSSGFNGINPGDTVPVGFEDDTLIIASIAYPKVGDNQYQWDIEQAGAIVDNWTATLRSPVDMAIVDNNGRVVALQYQGQ